MTQNMSKIFSSCIGSSVFHVSDLGLPSCGLFKAISALVEIVKCLLKLILGVQHEGSIVGNRLF